MPAPKILTPRQISSFIEAHSWKFARTMPDNPHWYVVRDRCRDPVEFERFVITIRETGYVERYGRRDYVCLDHQTDDVSHKYWTMGAPLHQTVIINRAVKALIVPDTSRQEINDQLVFRASTYPIKA